MRPVARPLPTLVLVRAAASGAAGAAWAAALVAASTARGQEAARLVDAGMVTLVVAIGASILHARAGHPVGRLLLAGGALWGAASLPLELIVARLQDDPGSAGTGALLAVFFALRGMGWVVLVAVLPAYFPDGRLPGPRWRRLPHLAAVGAALLAAGTLLHPHPVDERAMDSPNALGLPETWSIAAELPFLLGLALVFGCVALGLASIVGRWRRGDALTRQQVGLFGVACAVQLLAGAVLAVGGPGALVYPLTAAALPVAIAVAMLQHRLYDVPFLVNRSLVYAILTAAVVGVYVLVVAGVGAALNARSGGWLPVLATGVVAVAFQPLREAVQRGVNRLTYGAAEEPYTVVRSLGERLATASTPGGSLPGAIDALTATLRMRYLAVVCGGRVLAESGQDPGEATEVPLVHDGVEVGVLRAAPGTARRARDTRLLADLAHHVAPAAHAALLAAELRKSKERLVLAREEERRWLRRDLHDGVGPVLAAASLKVDTARNVLADDPRAESLLLDVRAVVQDAVTDVRRVVDGLRPPALDDLGLGGAIQRLATDLRGPLDVGVELGEEVRDVPAAVEVAAYRIVQEALTNIVRHAGAAHASVRVERAGGALCVEVADDGSGVVGAPGGTAGDRAVRRGAGLESMRERAQEVGGTLRIAAREGGGTLVTALLPTGAP